MKKKKKIFQGDIPFDYNGEMLDYHDDVSLVGKYDQKSNVFDIYDLDEESEDLILTKKSSINLNDVEVTVAPFKDKMYSSFNKGEEFWSVHVEPILKKNHVFEATMQYDSFERGRSSAKIIWKDEQGRRFPMFLVCLDELLKNANVIEGKVSGKWTFCKHGTDYGIQLFVD